MQALKAILQEAMESAFVEAGYDKELAKVSVSNRPDLCDYQSNGALMGAKKYQENPIALAEKVKGFLEKKSYKDTPLFSSVEAVKPGFLNVKLSPQFLGAYLQGMQTEEQNGLHEKEGRKILLDYGGANVAKPLHVGHLRSAVIGEALKRMGKRLGNNVVGDVHLGDWGLQMGLIITELEDRGELEKPFTISELEEIYPFASKKAKEKDEAGNLVNEEYANRAKENTLKLQQGDPVFHKVWERIMEVSVADLKKNYEALDVHFDLWKGESDADPYIPKLISLLEEKKLAYRSQGALVVDITEEGDSKEYPPCMIQKSDGASLYATSDLGTIMDREEHYPKDLYLYIADSRQALHYTQFFRVARRAELLPKETELSYIGFGTMNGKDGKPFKTREGGVLRLERLISETRDSVLKRMEESKDNGLSQEEKEETAGIVALAALKYGDLSNQATKDYIFDLEKFTAFEGNTGPYILYTIVRISSILRKYAESKGETWKDSLSWISENAKNYPIGSSGDENVMALAKILAAFQDEMRDAWRECAPHKICTYIYSLANQFNSFYHNVKILTEEDEQKKKEYIGLLCLSWKVLMDCIHVLGFSAPERM